MSGKLDGVRCHADVATHPSVEAFRAGVESPFLCFAKAGRFVATAMGVVT